MPSLSGAHPKRSWLFVEEIILISSNILGIFSNDEIRLSTDDNL